MNFTREPLIETVITPRDGYKLVLRSSKGLVLEEYFVDAVEVISFGSANFFRSLEKPKCFLLPVSDYEILEVREARMVIKTGGNLERGIKIGGGRETLLKTAKEEAAIPEIENVAIAEQRVDKRREKRRSRKRRGKTESDDTEVSRLPTEEIKKVEMPSLIPPPSTLISETITRYKVMQEDKAIVPPESDNAEEEIPF